MTPSTLLLYMEEQIALEGEAIVLDVVQDFRDGPSAVVLNWALFYPQGGGRPSDQGRIEAKDGTFEVERSGSRTASSTIWEGAELGCSSPG